MDIELTNILDCPAQTRNQVRPIRNEPTIRQNMLTDHEISRAEHERWLHMLQDTPENRFFVASLDGKVIGGIGLSGISNANRRADWGFYISQAAQRKGLGSAMWFKFLNYAFDELDLNKVNSEVLAFNAPVIALHRKFGFVEEGRRRAHVLRGGNWHDTVLLGLLKSEWLAGREATLNRLSQNG